MCTAVSNVGIISQGTIWGAYNGRAQGVELVRYNYTNNSMDIQAILTVILVWELLKWLIRNRAE